MTVLLVGHHSSQLYTFIRNTDFFFQVVKLETSVIETLNYFSGIIISVKTRSERQLLRLKQINMQLAAKIQHLEFSCSEKVRKHSWGNPTCLQLPTFRAVFTPGLRSCVLEPGAPLPLAKSSLSLPPSQLGWASLLLSLPLSTERHLTVAVAFTD